MNLKYCLSALMAMAILAACQDEKDIWDATPDSSEIRVSALREDVGYSRTTLSEEYKINWHENDQLSVFLGAMINQKFMIHDGAGTGFATFKGTGDIYITGGSESSSGAFTNIAYYPYNESLSIAQGNNGEYTIATSLPFEQRYCEGSFGQDAYHMVAVAESNRDYAFSFKNIGSMFMLYLKGSAEITKIELKSKSNKLAGECTIVAAYNVSPKVDFSENATSTITLDCMSQEGTGVQLNEKEATVFVFAVPPMSGAANDLTFTIYDSAYGYMNYENAAAYGVERNKYYTFGAKKAIEYKAADYNLPNDAVAWIGSDTYTSISSAVENSQPNDVIKVKPGKYSEVVNVMGSKNVTIQPANEGDEVIIAGIDHQTNGNPSTIIVNNLTIDNSYATEGWFIGTAQNIKPCVGAWGGNLSFNGCRFIVSGEAGAETGIMTWWIVNKMLLAFNDCTFEGKNNHTSAPAMQIYGDADLTVTNCTFNTYKDYSLKYVAKEGNVATFEGNEVNNSKYFVQLGSAPYAGNNYKAEINNTTLGEGVAHYKIDNDENQIIYIDGSAIAYNADVLASLLTANEENIAVKLADNIEIPITSLGSQTPGSGEYKLGGENTETITIDLNNKLLNITTTYWSGIGAKNDEATITIKNGTMTSSQATGTWNSYDVTFANCNYVIEDVVFEKAIAFTNAGRTVTMNDVSIKETHDYYALWVSAKGQTIDIDGLTINSAGRGIKIDDQYVDTPVKVTLEVSNATFDTKNKAAILVKSTAGADITLANINIENVAADKVNAVWCDENAASYNDLITVIGGQKKIEGQ